MHCGLEEWDRVGGEGVVWKQRARKEEIEGGQQE